VRGHLARHLVGMALPGLVALGLVSSMPAASSQAASTEPAGCVSETGSGGACVDGTALDGATDVTVSPDGKSVYAASETSRAVVVFSRDGTTGGITQLAGTDGCVSDSGTGGACADGTALVGPRYVAVSPDGKNLYFPASFSRAVAVFGRDGTTGALDQLAGTDGCVSESGTGGACAVGRSLDGARSVALSPDGSSVYITSYFSDALAVFSRDATTGALTQLAGTGGCVSETGTGGACADGTGLDGPRTVMVSPDGKHVYASSELSGAVSAFSRNAVTGALTQLGNTAGCVSQTGTAGACAVGRALGGAGGVALSPDGTIVYVASMTSDAVAVFSRDETTGTLTQLAGSVGCVSETGAGGCADGTGLDRSRSVTVSPDGKSVYVAAEGTDGVAIFSRNATTGAITQLAGTAGCVSETGTGGACADGVALADARSVAVSPDGASVYAASFLSSAVSVFSRDQATGALAQLGAPPSPPPPPPPVEERALSFSLRGAATVGGVAAANEDIVSFDGARFRLSFDGSDVGLGSLRIDAFSWLDTDSLLISFDAPGSVPGIAGTVDDSDVVRFDATSLGATTSGNFRLHFDGSDVGLTANAHDVDAVELLADGRILISITGSASLSGATARDEDLLAFTPTSLGDLTTGTFALSFEGSDVGLGDASEDVDAAAVDASGKIYLSTLDAFVVPGVTGQDEDVFVFTPTALDPPTTGGSYAPELFFDGSSFGLGATDVSAIDVP
jgi:6-phosphogluconolactonase (cycloisomerase 2 family)